MRDSNRTKTPTSNISSKRKKGKKSVTAARHSVSASEVESDTDVPDLGTETDIDWDTESRNPDEPCFETDVEAEGSTVNKHRNKSEGIQIAKWTQIQAGMSHFAPVSKCGPSMRRILTRKTFDSNTGTLLDVDNNFALATYKTILKHMPDGPRDITT